MCVIFVTDREHRVSPDMVASAYAANDSGAGVAWRKGEGDKTRVHWKKGLTLEEIVNLTENLPLPYACHFRIPTCGGGTKKLNHPFPIEPEVDLALEGVIKGFVLFHNGHWGRWKEHMLEAAERGGLKIPTDKWSDSRGMAWMAAHFGLGVLDLIDEKIVAFGPNKIDVFGNGWVIKDHIWCSNTHWEHRRISYPNRHTWDKSDQDKEDSQKEKPINTFLTPPASMAGGNGSNHGLTTHRYLPPAGQPHYVYCDCDDCRAKKKSAVGGAAQETPFERAQRKLEDAEKRWTSTPPQISKKKMRKARREFDRELKAKNRTEMILRNREVENLISRATTLH